MRTSLAGSVIAAFALLSGCASLPADGGSGLLLGQLGAGIMGRGAAERLGSTDARRALEAEYRALEHAEPGERVDWKGTRPQTEGTATAGQPFQVGAQNCRQLSHRISFAGVEQVFSGSACRKPDGSWTPVG